MIRILSLDQAPANIGYAYASDAERLLVGKTYEVPDCGDAFRPMFQYFKRWFNDLLDRSAPRIVTVEQIVINSSHINMPVIYRQFNLVAGIEVLCAERGIDVYLIEISAWRKRARIPARTPAGSNKGWLKEMALQRCFERNFKCDSHHAAEAVLMLDWALANWSVNYRHSTASLLRRIDSAEDEKRRAG